MFKFCEKPGEKTPSPYIYVNAFSLFYSKKIKTITAFIKMGNIHHSLTLNFQVIDFLSGKAPLNLTMRLGDHMMLIQLQLSTVNSSSSRSRAAAAAAAAAAAGAGGADPHSSRHSATTRGHPHKNHPTTTTRYRVTNLKTIRPKCTWPSLGRQKFSTI